MGQEKNKLPEGWEEANIGDVTINKVPQVVPDIDSYFTYVDISSIDNASKKIVDPKKLHGEQAPSRARQSITTNDILVSMTRPNLNAVSLVPDSLEKAIASTGFDVLRTIEIEPSWLYQHVRSQEFIGDMTALVQGALYPAIKSKDVRSYRIPIPPLKEQKRIVAKIEDLQSHSRRAREALETIPDLLEHLRQSVLSAAFRGDLTRKWREQKPGVEFAFEFIERNFTEFGHSKIRRGVPESVAHSEQLDGLKIPDSWTFYSVADLLRKHALIDLKDGNHGANHPKREEFSKVGLPFITAAQVENYSVNYDEAPKVNGSPLERLKVGFAEPGDVIFTHKGTVGRVGLCIQKCVLSPQTTYYRVNEKCLFDRYLMYFLSSPLYSAQYVPIMGQTTRNFVPIKSQYTLYVLVPPLEEQKEIANILDSLFKKLSSFRTAYELSINQLQQIDQSVLSKAFRGELVPQDPNDEPASILLERIRQGKARQEEEQKLKPKQRGKKMKRSISRQQDILTILQQKARAMTPEKLFAAGGFDEDSVDEFYDQLRAVVTAKQVLEKRKGSNVRLEAIK